MTAFVACKTIGAKDAADRAGLRLTQKGNKYWTNCFLHDDKTASLAVYEDGRGWYCFSCHTGGDAVKLYELLYNLPPVDAAHRLMADFALSDNYTPSGSIDQYRLEKAYKTREKRCQELLDLCMTIDIDLGKAQSALDDADDQSLTDTIKKTDSIKHDILGLIDRLDSMTDDALLEWVDKGASIDVI